MLVDCSAAMRLASPTDYDLPTGRPQLAAGGNLFRRLLAYPEVGAALLQEVDEGR